MGKGMTNMFEKIACNSFAFEIKSVVLSRFRNSTTIERMVYFNGFF